MGLGGALRIMLLPLGLAAPVAVAVPPAPSWSALIGEAGLYLASCAPGTWLFDRELVRVALRGGREAGA